MTEPLTPPYEKTYTETITDVCEDWDGNNYDVEIEVTHENNFVTDYTVIKGGDKMESDDFHAVLNQAGFDSSELNFKSK